MKSLILLLCLVCTSMAFADSEVDEWYKSKSEYYAVKEAIYGKLYATLRRSQYGKLIVFVQIYSPDVCERNGSGVYAHDPLYVNETLIKFSQSCYEDWNHFFATTEEGSVHIVEQFKNEVFVEFRTYDGTAKFVFSAKGFIEIYNQSGVEEEAI